VGSDCALTPPVYQTFAFFLHGHDWHILIWDK
jgi:uncharacterized membrane protein